jgi:branched-subunit amino acid transport protein AzlD
MLSLKAALGYTVAVGLVVFLCRAFPFLFLRPKKREESGAGSTGDAKKGKGLDIFLAIIEKVVPPAAMTVLAFNSIAAPVKENPAGALPVLAASLFTMLVHFWKRNFLISILGGTVLYMVLGRLF